MNIQLITNDVNRTFCVEKYPIENKLLKQLLIKWIQSNPDIEYVQGMNYIGYSLVKINKSENASIRFLNNLFFKDGFNTIYSKSFIGIWSLIYCFQYFLFKLDPILYMYLIHNKVQIFSWFPQWILTLFSKYTENKTDLENIIYLIEKNGLCGLLRLIIGILIHYRYLLIGLKYTEIILFLNPSYSELDNIFNHIDFNLIISKKLPQISNDIFQKKMRQFYILEKSQNKDIVLNNQQFSYLKKNKIRELDKSKNIRYICCFSSILSLFALCYESLR